MNKMAMFVEGSTEMTFVDMLIQEVACKNAITISKRRIRGGSTVPCRIELINAVTPATNSEHFVLIYDCGGDASVKPRMLDQYKSLTTFGGYSSIVCLRDVYPGTASDVRTIEMNLPLCVPTKPVKVDFILAIMEIEAWFLAEHTHFERIDSKLSCDVIRSAYGFDPRVDDMMLRPHPAKDLSSCYGLVGKAYRKGDVSQLSALDFSTLYLSVVDRFPYLKRLCDVIDHFLTSPSV